MRARVLFITMIFFNLIGCATGPGVNRHEYFVSKSPFNFPFHINVPNETRKLEVGAKMGEGSDIQSFIVGGLPAIAMLNIPGTVGGIRGKFAVGETFASYAELMSNTNQSSQISPLTLRLTYFQQYLIPGLSPRMKALLRFEALLPESGEVTTSGYVFDWEGQGMALTPGKEKDMLNEMVEQSLYHWATLYQENLPSKLGFPVLKKGQFIGNGVQVTYEVFGHP